MGNKSEAEVVLEIYQSVEQSKDKQKRLKSSTFWSLFDVKSRQRKLIDRITHMLDEQGLKVSVKSGETFGEEKGDDWIVLTLKISPPPPAPSLASAIELPVSKWFETMQSRHFESEREVETYFISPLLEQLGYEYDDIAIGFPVKMFKGVQKTITEADFVAFKGLGRDAEGALLIVEAKKSDKGITIDHISQAKSYTQELLPACYVVTNGQEIKVYQFNGMLAPDECVMNFDRSMLKDKWPELHGYVSKEATLKRKEWLTSRLV
jgi:hypothetical protein